MITFRIGRKTTVRINCKPSILIRMILQTFLYLKTSFLTSWIALLLGILLFVDHLYQCFLQLVIWGILALPVLNVFLIIWFVKSLRIPGQHAQPCVKFSVERNSVPRWHLCQMLASGPPYLEEKLPDSFVKVSTASSYLTGSRRGISYHFLVLE